MQTNGIAQPAPTLDAMIEAVIELAKISRFPVTEYRLHPDDWDALRKSAKPHMVSSAGPTLNEFCGLKIILDWDAERLPRK